MNIRAVGSWAMTIVAVSLLGGLLWATPVQETSQADNQSNAGGEVRGLDRAESRVDNANAQGRLERNEARKQEKAERKRQKDEAREARKRRKAEERAEKKQAKMSGHKAQRHHGRV